MEQNSERVRELLNHSNKHIILAVNLGRTDYGYAWNLQRKVFELRRSGCISDVLLLNEHHHVYTIGKNGDRNHLLAAREELRESGVEVYDIDRGGDVTYHGPGQLVGYPILDLHGYYLDIHRYLRDLEEVIIRTLAEYGIIAHRDEGFTGVWVGSEKVAAIGVRVGRWVTMHGFALNVNTDLSHFDRIIPCGIFHKGVTSLQRLLGRHVPIDEVSGKLTECFSRVFGVDTCVRQPEEFLRLLQNPQNEPIECLQ